MSKFIKVGTSLFVRANIAHCGKSEAATGFIKYVDYPYKLHLTCNIFQMRGGTWAEYPSFETYTISYREAQERDAYYDKVAAIVKQNTEEL
jgi:hypothetical protein